MRGYTQLPREQRYQIQALLKLSNPRPKSRPCSGFIQPRLTPVIWQQVDALIRQAWSPEQIRGRLQHEQGQTISHEWIYQHIYEDKRTGGDPYHSLRCQKKGRKRYGTYSRRGRIANHVLIDERPAVVSARKRIGDWEGDTVMGKGHAEAL